MIRDKLVYLETLCYIYQVDTPHGLLDSEGSPPLRNVSRNLRAEDSITTRDQSIVRHPQDYQPLVATFDARKAVDTCFLYPR